MPRGKYTRHADPTPAELRQRCRAERKRRLLFPTQAFFEWQEVGPTCAGCAAARYSAAIRCSKCGTYAVQR